MFPGGSTLGWARARRSTTHRREYWPEAPTRLTRLAESVEIIQKLFTGKVIKYRSEHFNLESARIYTSGESAAYLYRHGRPDSGLPHRKTVDGLILVGRPTRS